MEHIELYGDVDVRHPQLVLNSQALSLFFAPPARPTTLPTEIVVIPASDPAGTTRPAQANAKPQQELKRVIAKQAVHCVMAGQNGKMQTIDCDDLDMQTARSAEGKIYARTVNTKGNVHARDSEEDLVAGFVDLTLKPAKARVEKGGGWRDEQPADVAAASVAQARVASAKEDSGGYNGGGVGEDGRAIIKCRS